MLDFNFNKVCDSAYIKIYPGVSVDSESIYDGIIVDYDSDDRVIGIEILDFSKQGSKIKEVCKKYMTEDQFSVYQERVLCPT